MTFHNPITLNKANFQPFIWPELPELDAKNTVPLPTAGIFTHQLAGQAVALTGPVAVPDGLTLTLTIRFGDEEIFVLCPADALGTLMTLHDVVDDWQRYTPATTTIVFEYLLTDALAPAVDAMGGPFEVVAVAQDAGTAPVFGFKVALKSGLELTLGIAGSDRILTALSDLFAAHVVPPKPPELDYLPFTVALLGPSFTLVQSVIAASAPGDGFLLETDWSTLARAELAVAGQVCARASCGADGFRLKHPPSFPASQETPMSTTAEFHTVDQADLPVKLRIALGETALTLSQLRELQTGSVLPFAEEMPATVGLTANGKPFGRGELVRIDGQVAVRLTEIG